MTSLRRINQDDLRNHNLSVVLDSLLRATDQLSRADLAKETGLTKATMSVLVSLLMDNGVLEEGVPTGQSLYGRPSIPLLIRGGRLCGIGLQVNTDGYGIAVLDINGATVDEQWVDADMTKCSATLMNSQNHRRRHLTVWGIRWSARGSHCRAWSPMTFVCWERATLVGSSLT